MVWPVINNNVGPLYRYPTEEIARRAGASFSTVLVL